MAGMEQGCRRKAEEATFPEVFTEVKQIRGTLYPNGDTNWL